MAVTILSSKNKNKQKLKIMATIVEQTYTDDTGTEQKINVDIDRLILITGIPKEKEFDIMMDDDTHASETTTFIGISPKR